jgi:hypothetical protein
MGQVYAETTVGRDACETALFLFQVAEHHVAEDSVTISGGAA